MSTEHQQYSTENQAAKLREYALSRNIEIVETFTDAGKSGLRVDGRYALQELLARVESGQAKFSIILVYDVSRWGRFQDADESAYYEYRCKRAGITVCYCAEQFENDGSPVSTIVKGVKRAMAGEYSRELSNKVFAGQCRLIELGFRQGGTPGYGFKRLLLDQSGNFKGELRKGECKSIQTDRVILAPGEPETIAVVRRIYALFLGGESESQIARTLNSEGIYPEAKRPWSRAAIHEILTSEKYIGTNLYNRLSFKLKKQRVRNLPAMWIRKTEAFEPLVSREDFLSVQEKIALRSVHLSNEELLEQLTALYKSRGYLSGVIINEAEGVASSTVFAKRFGSLLRAYKLIGYTPPKDYRFIEVNRVLRALHPEVVNEIVVTIQGLGARCAVDSESDLLTINDEITVSLVIARCKRLATGGQWKIRFDVGLRPDLTIVARMDQENEKILDYYLLPLLDFHEAQVRLRDENALFLDAYRFDSLDYFYGMSERHKIRRAA